MVVCLYAIQRWRHQFRWDVNNGISSSLYSHREIHIDGRAQSVLGYFGFDRTAYGDKNDTTPRKWRWLQELRQQRERDIKTEMLER